MLGENMYNFFLQRCLLRHSSKLTEKILPVYILKRRVVLFFFIFFYLCEKRKKESRRMIIEIIQILLDNFYKLMLSQSQKENTKTAINFIIES